jgi:hypothetical protein
MYIEYLDQRKVTAPDLSTTKKDVVDFLSSFTDHSQAEYITPQITPCQGPVADLAPKMTVLEVLKKFIDILATSHHTRSFKEKRCINCHTPNTPGRKSRKSRRATT